MPVDMTGQQKNDSASRGQPPSHISRIGLHFRDGVPRSAAIWRNQASPRGSGAYQAHTPRFALVTNPAWRRIRR